MDIIRPTYLNINLQRLEHNHKIISSFLGKDTKLLAVIKANAYGHGSFEVATRLEKCGVDFFGVATIEEGIYLRQKGIKSKILVLGSVYPFSSFKYIIDYNLTPTISSFQLAKKLSSYCKKNKIFIDIHLKVDTGMSRIGMNIRFAKNTIIKISELSNLNIEGVFTHIAKNDSKEFTDKQIKLFRKLKQDLIKENLTNIKYFHCANTRTTLENPEAHFDMVRVGLGLYGLFNLKELKPVMELKTKIVFLKTVKKNTPISYDGTFITPKKMVVATIPIGYADGFSRALSNHAVAIVKGQKVKQIGRICMDMCMLDVSEIEDVKIGDDVILIGKSGQNIITADDLAQKCETINYEIVSAFTSRIPRLYED